ncbi:hypothetical protein Cni_G26355 [Canna indica]|uniref:Uncharacterized protein n=1 Tax=Canna indica TaxID=4628 RepID=A0AAQ3KYV4_9LILI|nr:hypothetical protein Cni_G26355 [Canna indica]
MINPYPFFAYHSDPRPETLAFCLFQPNLGRLAAHLHQHVRHAGGCRAGGTQWAGVPEVEIVVAKMGWPYKGDPEEVGTKVDIIKGIDPKANIMIWHSRSLFGMVTTSQRRRAQLSLLPTAEIHAASGYLA